MSGDKRKQGPPDTFITVMKMPCVLPTSSEQTKHDQSAIVSLDIAQSVHDESEETEHNELSDMNENFHVVDAHLDTHENDFGFQLSPNNSLSDKINYELLTKPFRNQRGTNETIRRFMTTWFFHL